MRFSPVEWLEATVGMVGHINVANITNHILKNAYRVLSEVGNKSNAMSQMTRKSEECGKMKRF